MGLEMHSFNNKDDALMYIREGSKLFETHGSNHHKIALQLEMKGNEMPIYDKQTLQDELQSTKENLQNIVDRIAFYKSQRNTSTTNVDQSNGIPQTFEEMDYETICGLISEIYRLSTELYQLTMEVKNVCK